MNWVIQRLKNCCELPATQGDNLKEQETKLSNDRNATELKRTQESVRDQEAFLANLGQLDICEIQTNF